MNWGDLWTYPFDTGVWGTVWSGVGSLLTAGSLFLGFRILRIDQKDKRRAQASKIAFKYTMSLDFDTDHLNRVNGTVYNHSDALIMHTAVEVWRSEQQIKKYAPWFTRYSDPLLGLIQHRDVYEERDLSSAILPGEARDFDISIPARYRVTDEDVEIRLMFMDANSVTWYRKGIDAPKEFEYWSRLRRINIAALKSVRRRKNKIFRQAGQASEM